LLQVAVVAAAPAQEPVQVLEVQVEQYTDQLVLLLEYHIQ
jgi:hypothetical protein